MRDYWTKAGRETIAGRAAIDDAVPSASGLALPGRSIRTAARFDQPAGAHIDGYVHCSVRYAFNITTILTPGGLRLTRPKPLGDGTASSIAARPAIVSRLALVQYSRVFIRIHLRNAAGRRLAATFTGGIAA